MLPPCSKLPPACARPPTVVHCISLQERRGCPGASRPVSSNDGSNAIHSGSILLLILSFPKTSTIRISLRVSLAFLSSSSVPMSIATPESEHGCCGSDRAYYCRGGKSYCGGCGGKISYLSRFTSVHILSVYSWGESGRHGSKYTLILQRWRSSTEHTRPRVLRCLSVELIVSPPARKIFSLSEMVRLVESVGCGNLPNQNKLVHALANCC